MRSSDASKLIKNYKEQQGKIPQQTIIENKTIRADDYLYAASNTIINLNQNKRVEITYNSIQPPTKPAGTATGTLTKQEYLQTAQNIKNFIETNKRSPNYATTKIGQIRYETLIYTFAKIINHYNTTGKLPDSIQITQTTGIGETITKPQASIGYNIQNYRVQFTDKSTGSTQSRTWDFGDGSKSIEKNPTHTYQPGTYTIKLTIQGYGITDTKTTTIKILPEPIQAKLTINTGGNWLQYPGQINLPLHNGINWISTYFKKADEPGLEEVGIIQDGEIKGKYYFYDWTPGTPTTVELECNNLQVTRNEKIYYDNMGGFEKLITYTIVTSKITDEMIKAWTNKTYEPGPLKTAYGTFLTGLTTIWLHDKLADEIAKNITWTRTKPIIVSVADTPKDTFMIPGRRLPDRPTTRLPRMLHEKLFRRNKIRNR